MAVAVKSVLTREWSGRDYALSDLEGEVATVLRSLKGHTIVSLSHSLTATNDGQFVGSALITYEES